MRTTLAVAVAFIAVLAPGAWADDAEEKGEKVCREVERLARLADFTQTLCLADAGEAKGSLVLLLLSSKPVFSAPDAKKPWLMVVAAAVGKTMNDDPTLVVEAVHVSDDALLDEGRAFAFPGAMAKRLQARVEKGEFDLERFYLELTRALVPYELPADGR